MCLVNLNALYKHEGLLFIITLAQDQQYFICSKCFRLVRFGLYTIECQPLSRLVTYFGDFLVAQLLKNLPAMLETQVRYLDQKDPLEKEMATHSSILAWKIPWTEEPGRLQSMGLQRLGHD